MSSKRPFSEVDGDVPADTAPPNGHSSSHPKKRKFEKKGKGKGDSINALKKRVRTIERRFKREESLPPNVMAELQRELATHKAVIAEAALRKSRGEMISKYHMVRFFERRKAERLAKQLQRKAEESEDPDEKEELRPQIHKAEVDVAYTRYFPFLEPYISLYAQDDDTKSAVETLDAERPSVWKEIEAALKEGEVALENLRERIPEGGVVPISLRGDSKGKDGKAKNRKAKDDKAKDDKAKDDKAKDDKAKDDKAKDGEAREGKDGGGKDDKAIDSKAQDVAPRNRKETKAKEGGTAPENPRVRNPEGPEVPRGVRSDGKTEDDKPYEGPPRNRKERRAMEREGKVWNGREVESAAGGDVSDGGFFDE